MIYTINKPLILMMIFKATGHHTSPMPWQRMRHSKEKMPLEIILFAFHRSLCFAIDSAKGLMRGNL